MDNNYPDDIRNYDNCPNSPFYDDRSDDDEYDELLCSCGALLESEDEIFSEECDACFSNFLSETEDNFEFEFLLCESN